MYCNNCGTKIRDDAAFCEECGTPVKKVDSPDPTNKEKMTKKGKSKPIIITIIAALLLIVTCVVILQTGVLNPVKHNLELGYKYLEEGKYDEAILAFNKVIEIDENNIEARFGLVDAYEGIEDYEKAEEILNQILELDNGNQKAREKISEMKKKAYAGKKLNYSVDEKDTEDINYYTGHLKCTTESKTLWEYESEVIPKTELDCISDVYVDEELVYFIAGGKLIAFDKYTGNIEWEIEEAGASNSLVFDKNNVYLSGYYGPNLLIVSKYGEIKHKDDDDSYGWVYDLKLEGENVVLYHDLPEEGGIKRVNISSYSSTATTQNNKESSSQNDTPIFTEVLATTTLSSDGNNTYGAYNLIDEDNSTAWVEGVNDAGIGQRIIFKADSPQTVNHIQILNGYCKTRDLYQKNNRVKTINIIFPDGTTIRKSLTDAYAEYQLLVFDSPIVCDEFSIEIQEVYNGSKYNDTCISEILIG